MLMTDDIIGTLSIKHTTLTIYRTYSKLHFSGQAEELVAAAPAAEDEARRNLRSVPVLRTWDRGIGCVQLFRILRWAEMARGC